MNSFSFGNTKNELNHGAGRKNNNLGWDFTSEHMCPNRALEESCLRKKGWEVKKILINLKK